MKIKKVVHPAGELIDFETVFEENAALTEKTDKCGHFERVEYTTDAYDDGVTYSKFCNVYLPWCYDPEDKEKRYNVMYYQHGNTCDPVFSYGKDPQKNNFFFAVSDFPHNDLYCPYYFYNSLQVLFK